MYFLLIVLRTESLMRLMHLSKEDREEQSGITNRQGINSVNLPTWYMPSYAYQDSSNIGKFT